MICDHQCLKDAFLIKATIQDLIKLQSVKFPFKVKEIIGFFFLSLCGSFSEICDRFALSIMV